MIVTARLRLEAKRSLDSIVLEADLREPSRLLSLTRAEWRPAPAAGYPFREAVIFERAAEHGGPALVISGTGIRNGSVLGRYFVRPWFDRGSMAGRLPAHLDAQGHRINLYHRGPTRLAYPEIEAQHVQPTQADVVARRRPSSLNR
jgi:hypothetical protein